jgi:hypothetical protein
MTNVIYESNHDDRASPTAEQVFEQLLAVSKAYPMKPTEQWHRVAGRSFPTVNF